MSTLDPFGALIPASYISEPLQYNIDVSMAINTMDEVVNNIAIYAEAYINSLKNFTTLTYRSVNSVEINTVFANIYEDRWNNLTSAAHMMVSNPSREDYQIKFDEKRKIFERTINS